MDAQLSENLPSPPGPLPARMLSEFAYYPRLAYLTWVQACLPKRRQGERAESADRVDEKVQHRGGETGRGWFLILGASPGCDCGGLPGREFSENEAGGKGASMGF